MENEKQTITVNIPKGYEIVNELTTIRDYEMNILLRLSIKPIKQNPRLGLIAQCKKDKINYPDFWLELWQVKKQISSDFKTLSLKELGAYILEGANRDWCALAMNFNDYDYRRHPHAENIIVWYACNDEDKKRWEKTWGNKVKWVNCDNEPEWNEDYEYRLRPLLPNNI